MLSVHRVGVWPMQTDTQARATIAEWATKLLQELLAGEGEMRNHPGREHRREPALTLNANHNPAGLCPARTTLSDRSYELD